MSDWNPELAPNNVSNRLRPCGDWLACRYCGPQSLRDERGQERAALAVALVIGAGALQALQIAHDAVEIGAHLRNLAVERRALRVRASAEQIEEAGILAAVTARLRDHAVELGLLLGDGFLVAADLLGAGRIVGAAAIDRCQLLLKPLADLSLWIDGGGGGCCAPNCAAALAHEAARIAAAT